MFSAIEETPLPKAALLRRYFDDGEYTDCFATTVPAASSLSGYVTAFYTTRLFKAERVVLRLFASISSSDDDAVKLSQGARESFAAWNVEDRRNDQLLLIDIRGQTGSWFMCEPQDSGSRLYFGSVVFRQKETSTGKELRWSYRLLLGAHRLYSRALLSAARTKILSTHSRDADRAP